VSQVPREGKRPIPTDTLLRFPQAYAQLLAFRIRQDATANSATVKASYSCRIGLASNLAATVAIANPIHCASVRFPPPSYFHVCMQTTRLNSAPPKPASIEYNVQLPRSHPNKSICLNQIDEEIAKARRYARSVYRNCFT